MRKAPLDCCLKIIKGEVYEQGFSRYTVQHTQQQALEEEACHQVTVSPVVREMHPGGIPVLSFRRALLRLGVEYYYRA